MSYTNLPRPLLVLAPMEDVTDTVFRQMVQRVAPFDLYMTEFTNVDGMQSPGRHSTIKRLRFEAHEQPLIAQVWGSNPDNYYKTALEIVDMGFVGIDINMGCPVKAVIKNAQGGAMIAHPERAVEVIQAVQRAVDGRIPVSVKTRLGTRQFTPEWIETLLKQDLAMLTIHLRTVKEMSLVSAHWELMPEIKALRDRIAPGTILIGNGDVQNRAQALELVAACGIDGAMIGRGVFHDPYAAMAESPWQATPVADKLDLYRQHVELFRDTWGDDGRPVAPLNKFCKTYVSGFDGAKELREKLMHCKNLEELHGAIVAAGH
ncbi:MAG: tRNA dihydrouridine synthase [Candidatus Saccharimonadales bacterium]